MALVPWIQVYSNLLTHPKTARLAEELGLSSSSVEPEAVAVGMLVGLWTWAIQNAYDGDLSQCSSRLIAGACRWRRKPDALIAGLKAAGWMDPDRKLHNWEQYSVLYMDAEDSKREKTRKRVQRYRDKRSNADVTQA